VDEFARWIAIGLAGLVTTLDFGRVVIGGGLVALGEGLLDPVRRHLVPLVLGAPHRPPVEVVAAALGPEAGAVGALIAAGDATVGVV
jgi:glucokinase